MKKYMNTYILTISQSRGTHVTDQTLGWLQVQSAIGNINIE